MSNFAPPLVVYRRFLYLALLTASGFGMPAAAQGQSAGWFVNSLSQVNQSLSELGPELRRYSSVPAAREGLRLLHQIEDDCADLVRRTRRGEAYESVAAAYQRLDLNWRDAAFRLRASGEISPSVTTRLNRIDNIFGDIDKRLGLKPPINRSRLRDLMIVTLTYMDALFDDIRLARGYSSQSEDLLVQGRLLRERLRQKSYHIDRVEHDEVVEMFTDFVSAWRQYAQQLNELNDPHVHRRLESIRRQGEEVFTTLRIPPPPDRNELIYVTDRLPTELNELADQVNRWGAQRLTNDQFRFVETSRALAERARRLANEVQREGVTQTTRQRFLDIDSTWRDGLRLMTSVDPRSGIQSMLANVNTSFREIRDLMGTSSWRSRAELTQLAAALEASAETFNIDIQRFGRLLTPPNYRDRLTKASAAVYESAKTLHRQLSQLNDQRSATETARQLRTGWDELTPLVNDLSGRGLASARADLVFTNYRELQPLVRQLTTLLVE